MSTLSLRNISKSFGDLRALAPINLEIREGEFFSLLGPSGCGKTTLLRVIAGLETPTTGEVLLDGVDLTPVPPQKRNVGIVFQNYALFPHMTVHENVAYGLEVNKTDVGEIRTKVAEILGKVHLSEKANVRVPLLSGGEQQRVAVARAVVVKPRVLLFDEPLSNLDYALRLQTREEIKRLQREVGITTVYVTHDQGEALALSDRIAVLNKGILQQQGTPEDLYFQPKNTFVASFIGHANLFSSRTCTEYFGISTLAPNELLAVLPEEINLSLNLNLNLNPGRATGRIIDRQFSGSSVEYTVEFHGQLLKVHCSSSDTSFAGDPGATVSIAFSNMIQRKVVDE